MSRASRAPFTLAAWWCGLLVIGQPCAPKCVGHGSWVKSDEGPRNGLFRNAAPEKTGPALPHRGLDAIGRDAGPSWATVCNATTRKSSQTEEARSKTWRLVRDLDQPAMERLAHDVQLSLEKRAVLCTATRRCNVMVQNASRLRVCLPVKPRVCDPNSARDQQIGGISPACFTYNISTILAWWRRATASGAAAWIFDYPPGGGIRPKGGRQPTYHELDTLKHLMRASSRYAPTHKFDTCAVVWTGHDLKCHPSGPEINAHDAVVRANSGQQVDNPLRTTVARSMSAPPAVAGSRTDFRVNCLHDSKVLRSTRDEICVVPYIWWTRQWGLESMNNNPHSCCGPPVRSAYNIATLNRTTLHGARFAWFRPAFAGASGPHPFGAPSDVALDRPLLGSGGNALYLAIAMCRSVDLYGGGLFSAGAGEPKIYLHYYDQVAKTECYPGAPKHIGFATDRIHNEILLHVQHVLGVFRWMW